MKTPREFGFYRPYAVDRGGVHPEPWHLSYAPLAQQALAAFSLRGAARMRWRRRASMRWMRCAGACRRSSRAT